MHYVNSTSWWCNDVANIFLANLIPGNKFECHSQSECCYRLCASHYGHNLTSTNGYFQHENLPFHKAEVLDQKTAGSCIVEENNILLNQPMQICQSQGVRPRTDSAFIYHRTVFFFINWELNSTFFSSGGTHPA